MSMRTLLLRSANETAALKHGYTRIVTHLEPLTVEGSDLVRGSGSRCSRPNIREINLLPCSVQTERQPGSTPAVPEGL